MAAIKAREQICSKLLLSLVSKQASLGPHTRMQVSRSILRIQLPVRANRFFSRADNPAPRSLEYCIENQTLVS